MRDTESSPAGMRQRLARFSDLEPYKETLNQAHGIPPEAPEVGKETARRFDERTVEAMAAIGVRFGD